MNSVSELHEMKCEPSFHDKTSITGKTSILRQFSNLATISLMWDESIFFFLWPSNPFLSGWIWGDWKKLNVYWLDTLPDVYAEFTADMFSLHPDRETYVTAWDWTFNLPIVRQASPLGYHAALMWDDSNNTCI